MKITSLVAITIVAALASNAHANRRSFGGGGASYTSNGKFGLGLELGAPTGLNGKLFLAPDQALDFGFGYLDHFYYNGYGDSGLHLYLDYLWHPVQLAQNESFKLPFYVGVGGRFWTFDYGCRPGVNCGGSAFGIRVPVGLDFDMNNVPLDIFIQLVPTLDFFRDYTYNNHSVYLDVDFSVGLRYWFS